MDDQNEISPPRRWPLAIALLATLAWLIFAAAAIAGQIAPVPPALRLAGSIAGLALTMVAPVAVLWLVAGELRERSGDRRRRTALMADHVRFTDQKLNQGASALILLEDRMTALTARIDAVAGPVARQHDTLLAAVGVFETTGARLAEAAARTEAATVALGAAAPDATAKAERLTALIGRAETDLQRQLVAAEAMLAALKTRGEEAEAQARELEATIVAGMGAIGDSSRRAQDAVAAPLAQLTQGVDAAFQRTAAAMDATRDGVHAQTNAMLASVDQARVTLDHIGGEAARQIKERLDGLLDSAGALGGELELHAARAQQLAADVSREFGILDAKLGNSAQAGTTALDSIAVRMTDARDAIHRLGEPIAATQSALAAVETRLAAVGGAADATLGALGTALPAAIPQVESLGTSLADLHDRVTALAEPIGAGGDAIAAAQARFETARASLDSAAAQLAEELTGARGALAEIETLTGSASLMASTELIEVFGRVRDVANQTAGTMRETLSGVVAEAEAALDQAGSSRAELAFGAPIRAKLAEVEALHDRVGSAAQAAAERITRRLLALTETVAGVEARIDEADTRFDVRARGSLAARSTALVGSLQAAAIDIAGLLSFDVEDSAWESYLKGDKSIFARRVVDQLDGNGTRAIGRHFQHDAEFRTQATHYIEEFEALIAQVTPDRAGPALAVTLLSSNVGRLYVALGQAIGRFG